ncbi:MAG: hypothetical protein QMC80_05975 [Thermoplasmatales archaeon]|nr:hypothetical protein [Thermoplasmatales archaeon]
MVTGKLIYHIHPYLNFCWIEVTALYAVSKEYSIVMSGGSG